MKLLLVATIVLALSAPAAKPRFRALLVHGYSGPLPHKLTEKACEMAPGQDVLVVAGTRNEMYAMADGIRSRCPAALGGGSKVRVLPWDANNTAEHVQCAAKLLHLSAAPEPRQHVVLTHLGFEHIMPRLQRTAAALRAAGHAPFFGRATLLYVGVPTPPVDAWRATDEVRYNTTAAIELDTRLARLGPCAWAACRADEL